VTGREVTSVYLRIAKCSREVNREPKFTGETVAESKARKLEFIKTLCCFFGFWRSIYRNKRGLQRKPM
jgi:hypothetical protein